ncbi:hypothetical protein P8C59_003635 [Phyllachora maydis]|uniref:MICOS complex subunit MIC12 n=1 Tax=Phyllachora maydis TaxID=1825666 RepID=A0AAD9I254_9PEZI|nr:hypothetical protein P8C59_003635 [Phyllachora maydis]
MGFPGGFVGGVTVTLSLAYLASLSHHRNRQLQSEQLRAQARTLHVVTKEARSPAPLPPPPASREQRVAQERDNLVETVKERWNDELVSAVRWAQATDWTQAAERAEDWMRRLAGLPPVADATKKVQAAALTAADEARETSRSLRSKAKSVLDESRAGSARAVAETKGVATGLVARGIEKGQELIGKAASSLEEGGLDPLKQSVEEALRERYIPIDERDHTRLRGL